MPKRVRGVRVYVAQIARNGCEWGGFSLYVLKERVRFGVCVCVTLRMYVLFTWANLCTQKKKHSLNDMAVSCSCIHEQQQQQLAAAIVVATTICVFASVVFLNLFVHVHVFRKSIAMKLLYCVCVCVWIFRLECCVLQLQMCKLFLHTTNEHTRTYAHSLIHNDEGESFSNVHVYSAFISFYIYLCGERVRLLVLFVS